MGRTIEKAEVKLQGGRAIQKNGTMQAERFNDQKGCEFWKKKKKDLETATE